MTFYQINVVSTTKTWTVEHRYSEFDSLCVALKKIFPDIPALPPKTAFKLKSLDGILKRRQKLDIFIKAIAARPEILNHGLVCDFLKLTENFSGAVNAVPIKIAELADLPMGVRDFVYLEDLGILFVALSDMDVVSRVDAYFTNLKLPWDKKNDVQTIVGAVLAYRVTPGRDSDWKFDRLWVKTYGFQTNILTWCPSLNLLAVGMDDGFVHGICVTPETGFKSHADVLLLQFFN